MKNFLIAVNDAAPSDETLIYSISIGVKSKARLFFCHAGDSSTNPDTEKFAQSIKDVFTKINLEFDPALVEIIAAGAGISNSEIGQLTGDYHIDLVIIGASGEGLKTTFYGSHISELINMVSCPVLFVPHKHPDASIDRIGYATELTDISQRIAEIVPFAGLFNASIEAFYVYPEFPQTIDVETYDVKKSLKQLRAENHYDKIDLHFIRTPFDNEPVKGIREFLSVYKPDLLVMCHKPKGLLDRLLEGGGTTLSVAKTSSIPILALNQQTANKLL